MPIEITHHQPETLPIKEIVVRKELTLWVRKWGGEMADIELEIEMDGNFGHMGLSLEDAEKLFTAGLQLVREIRG